MSTAAQLQLPEETFQHLKQELSAKLAEMNVTEDSEYVAEFILVLISNDKSPMNIMEELSALFGDIITLEFIQSVFGEIQRLRNPNFSAQPAEPAQQPVAPEPTEKQQVRFDDGSESDGMEGVNRSAPPSGPRSFANRKGGEGISKSSHSNGKKNFALKNQQNFLQAMNMAMTGNGQVSNFATRKANGRCKDFPHCPLKNCPFMHPTKPCFAFPNCPNAPGTCSYLHPGEDDELIAEIEKTRQERLSKLQSNGNPHRMNHGPKVAGITLCKFGAVCQKEDCPFGHPTPANKDAKVIILQWCIDNKNCANPECQKAHSSPNYKPNETQQASAGPEKTLEQCKFGALVSVDIQRRVGKSKLLPQVRSQETVSRTDGSETSLQGVLGSSGGTGGGGVDVLDTSKLQDGLDSWGGNDTGTSWSRNQSNVDGTTLTRTLVSDGVRSTKVGSPVTSSDWNQGQLGDDDGTSDGSGQLLGNLDTKTNVTVGVTNNNNNLHSGSLTSSGLLLHRKNLHHLVLETWNKLVDDLVLFHWQRVEVNLLNRRNLLGLHESSELGDWNPALLLILTSSASSWASSWTALSWSTGHV
ncbi:hypothetical protein OGAPHI_001748 [Ogataea philodendri]|uniref:Uncharacterized protein n=1 Tax=Ogataea philodendri TaxID=1378263 RepID=A0A9P8PB27_9ASCO|nr:uncharacterized protein OGAPHI_001748 [Ogataea philodendri]KAH3667994.1 hypothetical protein OGAPHI_001748 [Ogataea philodendri]